MAHSAGTHLSNHSDCKVDTALTQLVNESQRHTNRCQTMAVIMVMGLDGFGWSL